MKSNWNLLIAFAMVLQGAVSYAFCGFYVAKADATLFNNRSEVILVRNGDFTVITMGSDFKGDVKEFAMVVPVPVVLNRSDIAVVDKGIFARLDAYSSPRLAEYYDAEPCGRKYEYDLEMAPVEESNSRIPTTNDHMVLEKKNYGVTIEAQYTVGEYDIMLLSANESGGLKQWLIDNGYKIPAKAERVLAPYIKSNMKFFVVKVNLEEMKRGGYNELRPIQIRFNHPKFMLPLRLGMANSSGTQDMIVYAFSPSGRIECSNYRNVKVPTDRNIPLYIKSDFGMFYKDVFETAWGREGKNAVFLEYAWNVTPSWGGVKCDPCVGPPPMSRDFTMAGVGLSGGWNNIFFTRMHVRYDEAHFPADLNFLTTSNQEQFQARYVLQNPAQGYGGWDCQEGQDYLEQLHNRRKIEMDELAQLTGGRFAYRLNYIEEYDKFWKDKPQGLQEEEGPEQYTLPTKKGSIVPDNVLPDVSIQVSKWTWKELMGLLVMVAVMIKVLRAK